MIIWLILLGSFIAGIVVTVQGRLKTSKRRHIVGRTARFIGIGLLAIPFIVFLSIVIVTAISLRLGSSTESADTHGNVVGVLLLSLIAILFAANIRRLSVPIATAKGPTFRKVDAIHSSEADS